MFLYHARTHAYDMLGLYHKDKRSKLVFHIVLNDIFHIVCIWRQEPIAPVWEKYQKEGNGFR